MSYVVSWWSGESRKHEQFKTQESAEAGKAQLKVRSAALIRESYEPIRCMLQPVFEKMGQLSRGKNRKDITCRHGCLQRLCVPCVGEML